jgi:hypothetical protein
VLHCLLKVVERYGLRRLEKDSLVLEISEEFKVHWRVIAREFPKDKKSNRI